MTRRSPIIARLRATDFRCFSRLEFEPVADRNYLIGTNAQGKTSILEAICVAARLQSPRTTSLSDVVRAECPGFALSLQTDETHLQLRYIPPKRMLKIDSVEQTSTGDYLQAVRVAWFSNDDLEIVRGSGSHRRRYLDFTCSQIHPTYLRSLRRYEKALRSRNALLRDGRSRSEIAAFEPILIEEGEIVQKVRAHAIDALAPLISESCQQISGIDESIEASYLPANSWPLAEALEGTREREVRMRQTVVGPHRDDLSLRFAAGEIARFASEGQQRTVAVGLKLAQTRLITSETGRSPIILVDDVFGELDRDRRINLLDHLPATSQCFITTTHSGWIEDRANGGYFAVSNAAISAKSCIDQE